MQKQKTIFITGATGFVGSNLAYAFLNQGHNLKCLVRGKNAEERVNNLFRQLYKDTEEYNKAKAKLEIISGDITKKNLGILIREAKRLSREIESVFHCAASVSFDEAEKDKIKKQNIGGTENLLNFMHQNELHELHYISTAYVAGQREGVIYEEELNKGQIFNNTYEESKFKAEELVRSYSQRYNLKTTIYRPSIIVGNSKNGKTTNFGGFYSLVKCLCNLIKIFKEDLKRGGRRAGVAGVYYKGNLLHMPLRIEGIAGKTLNLVPIDYVVNVIIRVFNDEVHYNKTYHITNPNPPTLGYIQKAVCDSLCVSGVEIADTSDFKIKPMNQWEEFFSKSINNFTPYLKRQEPLFSDRNTQEILKGSNIKCPSITGDLISRLISYCIDTDWGKKNNESLLHSSINY